MGSNQSRNQVEEGDDSPNHQITIVNPTPGPNIINKKINWPKRAPPILSVEGHVLDPNRHDQEVRLKAELWNELITTIERFSNSRANLIANRQSQLQEKIVEVDEHVQNFTDSYINYQHKALAQMNDNCKKVEDINKTLDKCKLQSELCIDMLNKLNFLLPSHLKLEPMDPE